MAFPTTCCLLLMSSYSPAYYNLWLEGVRCCIRSAFETTAENHWIPSEVKGHSRFMTVVDGQLACSNIFTCEMRSASLLSSYWNVHQCHSKDVGKFPVNFSNRFRRSSEVTAWWFSWEENWRIKLRKAVGHAFFFFFFFSEGASTLLNHLVLFCWHLTFLVFSSEPGGRDCTPFRLPPSVRSSSIGAASRLVCNLCWSHHVAPH